MRLIPILALVLVSGCVLHNISPQELLRDSVMGLNDEARWVRMDLAAERVAPPYRSAYRANHQAWGRSIQIADVEILGAELDADAEGAVSTVSISWYSYSTMMLHNTVVRQRWLSAGRSYVLVSERVVDGDPDLLAPPESDEDGDEDGDGAEPDGRVARGSD